MIATLPPPPSRPTPLQIKGAIENVGVTMILARSPPFVSSKKDVFTPLRAVSSEAFREGGCNALGT